MQTIHTGITDEDLAIIYRRPRIDQSPQTVKQAHAYFAADRADASIMLKAQNDPKFPYADGKQVRNS